MDEARPHPAVTVRQQQIAAPGSQEDNQGRKDDLSGGHGCWNFLGAGLKVSRAIHDDLPGGHLSYGTTPAAFSTPAVKEASWFRRRGRQARRCISSARRRE